MGSSVGSSALDSWPEEWGQHPWVLGVQAQGFLGAALAEMRTGWWRRKEAPRGRVWAKPTSLSAGLHLLHKEGNHEVSLGMKGGRSGNNFLYVACLRRMFAI